ncbi:hypothetical protein [Antarcticirhabdus aurantiaca]|uniref:hypothetical protein n=1 Tax=Antarcticirhabdus aurantiaca TaxID=2606717 RepID=UPI00131E0ECD|nr:hypothetical protein [Antarcticirhabdus aurantiaca]
MKREALIRELRQLARQAGVEFVVTPNAGKGSHYLVRFGTKRTIIQSGELKPQRVKDIRKQLGID